MPDYVPAPDDDFDHWLATLTAYLTTDASAPALDAATKQQLTATLASWQTAFGAYRDAVRNLGTQLIGKDTSRKEVEEIIRKIVGDIQRDEATSDTQRAAMQVTIPKEGHTPVGEIGSHPVITRIDTSTRLRHRLFFADSETPASAAKPAGAKFCEIRLQLGGTPPVDPEKMESLAMESRSPHRNDFDPGDEGKTAFYACRWLNTTGKPGPWSQIFTAIVPG